MAAIPPNAPVDWHRQMSHLARERRVARTARRQKLLVLARRLGLLAAIVTVPAVGASDSFGWRQQAAPEADPLVLPMPFEQAGMNFPGSAFYYLEDTPSLAAPLPGDTPDDAERALLDPAPLSLDPARSWRIAGTDRDHARAQACMAMAIHYEAASESDAGMRAVAQVVMNRVAHPAWPNTVCGVVFQGSARATGCQFSFTCDGSLDRRRMPGGLTRPARIAREALAGQVYAPAGLATHYHTLAVKPYWAPSLDRLGTIGSHVFYRWKGAAGLPAAYGARYAGAEPAPRRDPGGPPAPDPISPPPALAMQDAPATVTPAAEPVASSAQTAPALPTSGKVRDEYARAGQWKTQP